MLRGLSNAKNHEVKPTPELQELFSRMVPVLKYREHPEAIRIGAFRICRMGNGSIWIGEAEGGEGGEFKEAEIEKAVHKFYAENL